MKVVAPVKFVDNTSQTYARTRLAEFDMTSSDSVSTTQQASATHHNLFGTPTVTRSHTLPDVTYALTIYNGTSQVITIKRASTTGVPLAAGVTAIFTYNAS